MPEKFKSSGLSGKEAKARLKKYGPNVVVYKIRRTPLVQFFVEFKNPLVLILIVAAAAAFFLGEITSSVIIILMVLLSTVLDFINTYKSQKAAEALREKVRITATVLRDRKIQEIPLIHLVPGDVVLLEPGDVVPADGKIIESKDFFVDESSLTGESFPMEKREGQELFMGSNVITGEARLAVEFTGTKMKFSNIARELVKAEEKTEFDRGIEKFSFLILKIVLILVVAIFFANAFTKHDILNSFLFALALAVGLTPELLPMIITFNLAKGSLALSKQGVIVKKLSAIQNFGSMDVLCTDKTGTLTEGKIVLVKCVDGQGEKSEDVLLHAYLSSYFESGVRNPLDNAIREFENLNVKDYKKISEIPFDYSRKKGSVIVQHNSGARMLVSKGVPEEIIKASCYYGTGRENLSDKIKERVFEVYQNLSREGFRVLAIAKKDLQGDGSKEDEKEMVFVGFAAFLDPPKATVEDTLKILKEYGVEIKILTGDNELVTQKIAQEINLPVKGTLMGEAIQQMDDLSLGKTIEEATIFARLSPDQKTRVIRALQKNGHVVGYLGDGINDAPALKAADAGISVNNAVDVAKESADLILLRKSLWELVNGIIEGRKTFANAMKYLMMNLSSNFGNMFSMAGASLFLPFLPMLPSQILLNNLLYDTSQFTIPLDKVDQEDIKKPRKWDINFIKKFMLVFGPVSSLYDFATYFVLFYVFHLSGSAFQTGWFLESLATQTLVVHIIRSRRLSFIKSRASGVLFASTLAVVVGSWLLVFSGWGKYLQFTPLGLKSSLAIIGIVAIYLINVEIVKKWFFKKLARKLI